MKGKGFTYHSAISGAVTVKTASPICVVDMTSSLAPRCVDINAEEMRLYSYTIDTPDGKEEVLRTYSTSKITVGMHQVCIGAIIQRKGP